MKSCPSLQTHNVVADLVLDGDGASRRLDPSRFRQLKPVRTCQMVSLDARPITYSKRRSVMGGAAPFLRHYGAGGGNAIVERAAHLWLHL